MAKVKLALGLLLLLSLLGLISPISPEMACFGVSPATASPDVVKWSMVNISTDVARLDSNYIIAVGTRDTENSQMWRHLYSDGG